MQSESADANVHPLAARGFNLDQTIYEAARPTYPPSVVNFVKSHLVPQLSEKQLASTLSVLDLAAGTGKWTRLISSFGINNLVAVEPSENMRKQFVECIPEIPIFSGSATSIPFPNEAFDAVFIAQAFHWFASVSALTEISRVLKKDGIVILIWNMENGRASWVGRLREAHQKHEAGTPQYRLGLWRTPFLDPVSLPSLQEQFELPFEERQFEHSVTSSKEGVWQRVLSKSYIAVLDEEEKQKLKEEVDDILEEKDVPWFSVDEGDKLVKFPYTTDVVWFKKRSD